MSLSRLHAALGVVLLLSITAVPFRAIPPQSVTRKSASVTISPAEATVHVGETQAFEADVQDTQSSGVRWVIQEHNGGRITEDGTYTAPRHVGLYHVIATSEENPAATAVARVTVVTEYDRPEAATCPTEPSVVLGSHFVDHLSNCGDDGIRRLRHAVVVIHDDLPAMSGQAHKAHL